MTASHQPTLSSMTRRGFLYAAAAVAGGAALSACTGNDKPTDQTGGGSGSGAKGSATKPLPKPNAYQQAPSLDGKGLPPVAERLPENPYVIPHRWAKPGKYGGQLNMNVVSTQGAAKANSDKEFFYGHSIVRYLNDGQDIGPGLAESWEANDDATEWTFHFRKGLKWSDGEPWTTGDIMWWWEKFVLPGKMSQIPPDDTRSGKGTIAKLSAPDDLTLTMTFDAPAPMTADKLAAWANGANGDNGPIWMMPSHYLKQFHPDYGKNVPDDWDSVGGIMTTKCDWHRNPDCPTMTGYRCKSFNSNKGVVLERNPYYWAVMPNGDQVPYIDEIQVSVISDPESGKLQVQQGSIDYCQGSFNQIGLTDVAGIRDSTAKAGTEIVLWDSGSGTGSIFFFNYDYIDPTLRKLFREPKFRQAVSYAFDRDSVRKGVYFNTGDKTTGTLSPKAKEFQINDEGKKVYTDWRDSYVQHDPDKAKQILDELGLKDTDGDGFRELPGGKPLKLRLDYSADQSAEHTAKDNQLIADLKAVGLRMDKNPIPPQSFGDQWATGKLMTHTNWEVGDGHPLIYAGWVVPVQVDHWAPLQGRWYSLLGTPELKKELDVDPYKRHPPRVEPEADSPVAKLQDFYNQARVEPDELKRAELIWEIFKIHTTEGPFFMGCVANYPQVMVIKKDLRNVPRKENLALGGFVNPWIHPTPAVYDPECYYWENPDDHTA
ncbi:ABC transporter substrate-binding protein [Microlunatus elymi]|uniref:ABC transporter substrate-binding protein n=1 Tax=Microlunatus elymi TaxID=2596828 RepID=A0A516PVC3_9ACTN|nr:ABC transporter substrate-binding protein [Microlunatus elymi]QDP95148.1 ABC transporter substrate-binding protein [Microlunatus elymi]